MANASIQLTAEDKTKAAFDSARKNMAGLGEQAAALPMKFGTIGLAITAALSGASIKGAIDVLDRLDDLSEKTGVSVESLSALRYAGEVTGTSLDSLAIGVGKLSKNMFEAADGNKEAVAAFDELGVSVKNSDGTLRSQDAVLGDLANRFKSLDAGAYKSAMAQKVFGKSGADMIPLLNQGADGIKRLSDEATALGLVFSGDTAKAAAEFNDNLKKMELIAESAKIEIANGLLPTIVRLTKELIEGRKAFGSYWNAFVELGLKTNPFDTWSDNAKKAATDVERLAAEVARLEAGKRATSTNEGGAAFVGASGTGAFRAGRIEAMQRELETAKKRKQYFDKLIYDSVSAEATRLEGPVAKTAPKVTDKGDGSAAKAVAKELKEQAKIILELNGLTGSFTEDWERLNVIFAKGSINLQQLTEAQAVLLSKQPAIKAQAEAEQKLLEIREKNDVAMRAHADTLAATNEELIKSNRSLLDEVEEIGLSAEALVMVRAARVDANIARAEEALLAAKGIEGNEAEIAQLERKVNLLKQERGIKLDGIYKEQRAAEVEDAKRRTQTISESISEGVIDGFRNGSSVSDIWLRELKAQFAKTILEPVIRPQVEAGNSAISGLLKGVTGLAKYGGSSNDPTAGNYVNSFDAMSDGGGGGGILSGIAKLFSFDGGGYTGDGLRTGGLDGKGGFMAMMHPQETVLDHTKGQGMGGGFAPTTTINVSGGMSSAEVYKTVQHALAENNRQWAEQLKRQGVLA